MKMMKEIQEEPIQELSLSSKDIIKKDEPLKNDTNIENFVSNITTDIGKLSIKSEPFKSPKKEIIINKEDISKTEKDDVNKKEKELFTNFPKKNLTLSSLISNDINANNSQTKTPLKQDSAPFSFKQKGKNFQEKSSVGTASGNEYKYHRNSISMKNLIYSYFDESQKYLSEQYGEENYLI